MSPKENLNIAIERNLTAQRDARIHNELNLTWDQYVAKFGDIQEQPRAYSGMYDYLVLVPDIIKLPLDTQIGFINGINYIIRKVEQWGTKPPKGFYATWTDASIPNRNKSIDGVQQAMNSKFSRGGNIPDGVMLALGYPEIVRGYAVDLPGAMVGADGAACLYWHGERPLLYDSWVDNAYPHGGSLVAGSK